MPTDANGVFHESTNADRAEHGRVALEAYCQYRDHNPLAEYDGDEDGSLASALSDLLNDLLHVAGPELFFARVEIATVSYHEEVEIEAMTP